MARNLVLVSTVVLRGYCSWFCPLLDVMEAVILLNVSEPVLETFSERKIYCTTVVSQTRSGSVDRSGRFGPVDRPLTPAVWVLLDLDVVCRM